MRGLIRLRAQVVEGSPWGFAESVLGRGVDHGAAMFIAVARVYPKSHAYENYATLR